MIVMSALLKRSPSRISAGESCSVGRLWTSTRGPQSNRTTIRRMIPPFLLQLPRVARQLDGTPCSQWLGIVAQLIPTSDTIPASLGGLGLVLGSKGVCYSGWMLVWMGFWCIGVYWSVWVQSLDGVLGALGILVKWSKPIWKIGFTFKHGLFEISSNSKSHFLLLDAICKMKRYGG